MMDKQAFGRRIVIDISRFADPKQIDYFVNVFSKSINKDDYYTEADARNCIQMVDLLRAQDQGTYPKYNIPLKHESTKGKIHSKLPFLGRIGVSSAEWQSSIKPDVAKIRISLFGKPEAPFPMNFKAANKWIESKAKEPCREFLNEYDELRKLIYEKHELFMRNYGLPFPLDQAYHQLVYLSNDVGVPQYAPAWSNPDLYKLCAFSMEYAEGTGFFEGAITSHVLTDLPLMKPNTYIGQAGPGNDLKLIVSPDSTRREVIELHKNYFNTSGKKKRKRLTHRDEWFYNLVQGKGGPPSKVHRGERNGASIFWGMILIEYKKKYKASKMDTWQAAKLRYERLLKKLKA
jgi:hypothetical protein